MTPGPADAAGPADRNRGIARLVAAVALCIAVTAIGWYFGRWHDFIDLEVYRGGARTALEGLPVYETRPLAGGMDLPFTYPPPAILFFIPLMVLPAVLAHVLFFVTSMVCLIAVLRVFFGRIWPGWDMMTALTAAVLTATALQFFEPVYMTLLYGQINLVLMLLITLDILGAARYWPRGLLLGFAVAIKLTPAVFVLFFLLRRDWRAAATTVATTSAVIGAAWLVLPADSAQYWFRTLWNTDRIGAPWYANNQSIHGVISRLPLSESWQSAVWLGLSGLALALAAYWMSQLLRAGDPVSTLLVNALLVLLVSPVSWTHHWVWAAPALIVAGRAWWTGARNRWVVAAWLLVATVFVAGPSWHVPLGGDRELEWGWWIHVVGNAYVLVGAAVLAGAVLYRSIRHAQAGVVTLPEPG